MFVGCEGRPTVDEADYARKVLEPIDLQAEGYWPLLENIEKIDSYAEVMNSFQPTDTMWQEQCTAMKKDLERRAPVLRQIRSERVEASQLAMLSPPILYLDLHPHSELGGMPG